MRFFQTFQNLWLLPNISLECGECSNPHCRENHHVLVVSWLFWGFTISWSVGGHRQ